MLRKNAKVELISKVPLLAGCSKKQLGEIAQIADEIDLPEGRVLIREGERGREFFILVEGRVSVTREGRKLNELGPSDYVGEIALVSDVPRIATVTALTPLRVLVITDRGFARLLRTSPEISAHVMQKLAERIAAAGVL